MYTRTAMDLQNKKEAPERETGKKWEDGIQFCKDIWYPSSHFPIDGTWSHMRNTDFKLWMTIQVHMVCTIYAWDSWSGLKRSQLRSRQMFAFYRCCLIGLSLGFASELQFVPALSEAIGYFPSCFRSRGMEMWNEGRRRAWRKWGPLTFFSFQDLKKKKHAAKTRKKKSGLRWLPSMSWFNFAWWRWVFIFKPAILLMFLHERCLLTMDSAYWRTGISSLPPTEEFPSDFRWFQGIETSGARAAAPAVAWHPTRSHAFVALARFGSHAVGCATHRKGYLNQGTITNPTMGSSENHRLKSTKWDGICDRSQEFFLVKGSSRMPIWKDVLRFIG